MRTGTPAFDEQEPLRFTIATADGSIESIATTDVPRLSLQRHLAQEGEDLIADVLAATEESLKFLDDPERMVIDEKGYRYFGFDAAEQHFTKTHQINLGHLLQNAGLDTDTATANIRIHEDTRMLGELWLLRFAFLRDGSQAYHEREPLFDLLENYLTQSIGIHTALLVCDDLSEVAELEETLFRLEKLRRPVRAAFTAITDEVSAAVERAFPRRIQEARQRYDLRVERIGPGNVLVSREAHTLWQQLLEAARTLVTEYDARKRKKQRYESTTQTYQSDGIERPVTAIGIRGLELAIQDNVELQRRIYKLQGCYRSEDTELLLSAFSRYTTLLANAHGRRRRARTEEEPLTTARQLLLHACEAHTSHLAPRLLYVRHLNEVASPEVTAWCDSQHEELDTFLKDYYQDIFLPKRALY